MTCASSKLSEPGICGTNPTRTPSSRTCASSPAAPSVSQIASRPSGITTRIPVWNTPARARCAMTPRSRSEATMRLARSSSMAPSCLVALPPAALPARPAAGPALTPPFARPNDAHVRLPRAFCAFAAAIALLAAVPAHAASTPRFTRVQNGPVLSPTRGFYDDYMIASPSVVNVAGTLYMVYAGHCQKPAGYTPGLPPRMTCPGDAGIFLLGATSRDGRHWTKRPTPVLRADPSV